MSDTYAACLTPPGAGAIAVIAVRGPQALGAVQELFQPLAASGKAKGELVLSEGRFLLGRFGTDAADEVVLSLVRSAPVPWLELHCHGGVEVVRLCLESLRSRGIQAVSWQQLEQLTADNPLQALAVAALAQAPTVRTAAILLDQQHGAFQRVLQEIVASLTAGEHAAARRQLTDLASRCALGRHLTIPWRVVIAGAPNVGKSSLLNALAGYQRSVVSAIPGTTRDVVATLVALEGWPIELSDTAGLRDDAAALEAQGIEQARTAVAAADLCLWVLDGAAPPVWPAFAGDKVRFVINKVDRPAAWSWEQVADAPRVSAQTGAGIADVCAALARWLVPEVPPAGSAVPFTPGLCAMLEESCRWHDAGKYGAIRGRLETVLSKGGVLSAGRP